LETPGFHSQFKPFVRASAPTEILQLDTSPSLALLAALMSGSDLQGYFHEMKEILIKCSYLCQPGSE